MRMKFKLGYFCFPWHRNPKIQTRKLVDIIEKVISKYSIVPITSHFAFDLLHGAMVEPKNSDPLENIWEKLPTIESKWDLYVGVWDLALIVKCDVFIVCAPINYSSSAGMVWEYCLANLLGKKIRYWDGSELVEKYPWDKNVAKC